MSDRIKITIEIERGILYMRPEYVKPQIAALVDNALRQLSREPSITEPGVTVTAKLAIEGARR